MAFPGELVGFDGIDCDCGEHLKVQVCQSNAGYYLGYMCPNCGPYSRETGYYPSREKAQLDLEASQVMGVDPSRTRTT